MIRLAASSDRFSFDIEVAVQAVVALKADLNRIFFKNYYLTHRKRLLAPEHFAKYLRKSRA